MEHIEGHFLETLDDHGLIPSSRTLVVGVSGGPDSVCLLHLFASLLPDLSLHAVYIDHNLRPGESAVEKNLVKELCRTLSVDYHYRFANVPQEVGITGGSIEAIARNLRYRELESLMSSVGAGAIAVGHTSDDQAEEILIRLIRGSGLKGLSGMSHKNGLIIRPLLDVSKREILEYLDARNILFCRDSSNESKAFLRNRVRIDLLPMLEEQFNPSIRKSLIKTARILKDEEDFLHRESIRLFDSVALPQGSSTDGQEPALALSVSALAALHPAIRRRIIETALWRLNCTPNTQVIEALVELGLNGVSGSELHLADRIRGVKQRQVLLITRLPPDRHARDRLYQTTDVDLEIGGPGTHDCTMLGKQLIIEKKAAGETADLPTLAVSAGRVKFPLRIRLPLPGERFHPAEGRGSKKVTRFLSDRKIPRHERNRHPVLVSRNRVVCVLGLMADRSFAADSETEDTLQIRWRDRP